MGTRLCTADREEKGGGNTWSALFAGEGLGTWRWAAAVSQLGPDLGRGRLDLGRGTVAVRDRRRQRRTDDRYARETRTREGWWTVPRCGKKIATVLGSKLLDLAF